MKNILILGATSAIAEKFCLQYVNNNSCFILVGRNSERMDAIKDNLLVQGAGAAHTKQFDLAKLEEHKQFVTDIVQQFPQLDIVLVAYGKLSDQAKCQESVDETLSELNINLTSVISLLTLLANQIEKQGRGCLAVISSVAGDRGRQSNYIYGTAKGALTIFMQGLRNRLNSPDIQILTIKPGFVDTPMTKEFKKGLLWVGPETIAKGIVRAINRKKDVVYLPFFWRYIMLVIKLIPERIFKKLSL